MKLHESINIERLAALATQNFISCTNYGVCIACGEEANGVEPDSRDSLCDHCHTRNVWGVDEIILNFHFETKKGGSGE